MAGSRHLVTRPIIPAGTVQLAVGAIRPWWAFQFAELPGPPKPTQTGAVSRVADSSILAGARLLAACPVLVFLADVFTAGTSSSCWTNADACHMVTGGTFSTGTQVHAVLAIATNGAADAAVSADVPSGTLTCPCGGLTASAILTLTLLLTIGTIPTS